MCKQRASTVNLVEEEQSNNDFYLDAATVLDVQEERNAWTVDLDFYGKLMKFKVGTGADVTVLKEADFRKLPRRPQVSPSQIPYLNSPGGKVDTVGEFIANVTRSGQGQGPVTYRFRVVVVPSSAGANLLARLVSEAMGLVKRLEEVDIHDNIFGSAGLLKTEPVKLTLKDNAKPYCVTTVRRIPFPLQSKLKEELKKIQRDGVIKKVTTPTDYCVPIVPVKKKNGKIRLCVNLKKKTE